ncbi:MAG TPA: hypothetical protein VEU32_07320 [Burkholderiales bacterium]|nr:hypothetical protein [Burkholderiales bacterium]
MTYATNEFTAAVSRAVAVIRVFESADHAAAAIGNLERSGFDISKLSLIGREEPSAAHQLGIAVAGAHATVWGQHAALWNRLAEAPAGMALAWVPFIGYVVAVGPAACVLAGSQWHEQAGAQGSPLVRMLRLAGMSPGELRTYEAAVRGGQILLLVHGTGAEATRARRLLGSAAPLSGR